MDNVRWHLKTYPMIVVLTLGLLGNGMIFLIFLRKNFRNSSINKFIRILVISDTTVLCSGVIPIIYSGFNEHRQLTDQSLIECTLLRFVMFYSGDVAVWILVIVTVDRLIAVVYPLHNRRWKSNRNSVIILSVIFGLALLKNFSTFFTFVIKVNNKNMTFCDTRDSMLYYERAIRPSVSLVMYYLIPVIALTTCTVLIIKEMKKIVTRMRSLSNMKGRAISVSDSNTNYSKSLTKMSIAINILFIVLITPSFIIWTWLSYYPMNSEITILLFDITNLFVFNHHALNFYLFVFTGPRFRREVLIIFGKKYVEANDSREQSSKTRRNVSQFAETCT